MNHYKRGYEVIQKENEALREEVAQNNKTINIVIFDDGMIQIEDIKENQNPLISTYQVTRLTFNNSLKL